MANAHFEAGPLSRLQNGCGRAGRIQAVPQHCQEAAGLGLETIPEAVRSRQFVFGIIN